MTDNLAANHYRTDPTLHNITGSPKYRSTRSVGGFFGLGSLRRAFRSLVTCRMIQGEAWEKPSNASKTRTSGNNIGRILAHQFRTNSGTTMRIVAEWNGFVFSRRCSGVQTTQTAESGNASAQLILMTSDPSAPLLEFSFVEFPFHEVYLLVYPLNVAGSVALCAVDSIK